MSSFFSKSDSTGIIHVRQFDPQKLISYAADRNFKYDDTPPVNMSWWDRFWSWFWSLIEEAIGNGPASRFIGWIALVVLLGLVIFLVFKLLGMDLKFLSGKSKEIEVPYAEVEDNIHEINFTEEIEKAIATNNYRLAVRLYYLRTLKQLSDANQIDWKPEKTNQTYISEISDLKHQGLFRSLTNQFEWVWYGDFYIDKQQFDQIKPSFESFNPQSS